MEKILSVSNLKKNYGAFQAVKGISFSVEPKEIFALIGPNGAGKSTTLKVISTLLSITDGEVTVAGFNLGKDPQKVRQVISYLPEEAGAYKNLKGIDYLNLMAELYAKDRKSLTDMVERGTQISALGSRLDDKVSTYSKGMTRKLLLARTVMVNPRLTILDEPTSGLDIINAIEIRRIIRNLSKDGMSVLLSSHNMLEIEFLSDKVAIIDNGIIHDEGTPSELKKKYQAENLEEVFEKAVK